ncbi:polymorphic toxin-type HINT domain-containing protein [Chryseobacterium antibioticum]|uniref:Polymorphic toxin-type HINT domain-containing protein n=1 Tax=Chryseobacterium pyrolae TaxID=2987481 RepID=A0ABT2ILC6_9FLAO|nr:polymorphic toxin-type HINT domain-containing protein [Chryseobacterium pyrolae]MCT2409411.1 polymorphic toxin-type HINT domain-containing protein [Chryseobacterium pyrolae]
MDELEYITLNALMMCDQGAAPDFFKPTYNTKVKIHGCLVATNKDATPLINIPSFKVCKITGGPCTPATVPMTWQDTWQVKINGIHSLIGKSTCRCPVGGKVEFMTSGQVPLPDDAAQEVKDMQDQAQRELDDNGQGDSVGEAGLVEGMIPVWGSGRDLINDIQTGDGWGAAMNAGFLIWDVASITVGVVSFGTGTVAMQGAKAGIKGAIKAGAKAVSKEALQQMGKAALKKLSKEALKKSVDDIAKKLLKTCVFACFPAGTPVHTEQGIKNIEDITVGDMVWAYDEDTDTVALQPVIDLMVNESDHTISIYTEAEVIETTAIHPFYTENGWKDASELEAGEKIITKGQTKISIEKTEYSYEPKKVYNFTVAHFHTYFVGLLALLVHNSGRCLSQMMLESQKWFQKVRRGYFFNLVWNSELRKQALEKGFRYSHEVEVLLKKGKVGKIDGLIENADGTFKIIERKASDLTKITDKTIKSYIDDAAKYNGKAMTKTGEVIHSAGDKVILHVEKVGNLSKDVLDHATKKGVEIVDNISGLF